MGQQPASSIAVDLSYETWLAKKNLAVSQTRVDDEKTVPLPVIHHDANSDATVPIPLGSLPELTIPIPRGSIPHMVHTIALPASAPVVEERSRFWGAAFTILVATLAVVTFMILVT